MKKYFFYALGEILLVVLGILIALQINDWNSWRKDRIKEKVVLHDLLENIQINVKTLEEDIKWLKDKNVSTAIVLNSLETRIPWVDTLKKHLHNARITKQDLFLSQIGYKAYQDQGLNIITNKVLSREIVNLYELTIPSIMSTKSLINEMYPDFDNFIVQNFNLVMGEGLMPNNYEALLENHYYLSWIRAHGQGRLYLIEDDMVLIAELQRVAKLIKEELKFVPEGNNL